MNPLLELAQSIGEKTDGLCEVGPGPFGLGVSYNRDSEVSLVLHFDPDPVVNHVIFPEEIDRYQITVKGYRGTNRNALTPKELEEIVAAEGSSQATRTIASAVLELGEQTITATRDQCGDAFDLMARYDLDSKKGYLNHEPYVPEDGSALRYTKYQFSRDGKPAGNGICPGHIGQDEFLLNGFITEDFSTYLSLGEITVSVHHCVYGEGELERDVNEEELGMAIRGALSEPVRETVQKFVFTRADAPHIPISPLTERGMSLFFTAAAETAEEQGFQVDGVVDGQLQISLDGDTMIRLYENGAGSCAYIQPGAESCMVLVPTGDHVPAFLSESAAGSINSRMSDLIRVIKEARAEIPEMLYPHDYSHPNVPPAQEPAPTMNL